MADHPMVRAFNDMERDKLLDIAEASAIEIPRLRAALREAENWGQDLRAINAELLAALEEADAMMERAAPKDAWEVLCKVGDIVDSAIAKAKEASHG